MHLFPTIAQVGGSGHNIKLIDDVHNYYGYSFAISYIAIRLLIDLYKCIKGA